MDIVRELSDSEDGVWFLAQHADIVLQFLASVLRAQKVLPNIHSLPDLNHVNIQSW